MKIAYTSDLHVFYTTEKQIKKMFKEMAAENPDVVIIAGDHSGTHEGWRGSRRVFQLAREAFPTTPILACLGNHDYWIRGQKRRNHNRMESMADDKYNHPSLSEFMENIDKTIEEAKNNNIHLFEVDGAWRPKDIWGYVILGHGLWYKFVPDSNDEKYMPLGLEGDTHRYMYKRTLNEFLPQLDTLTDDDLTRIFVSHFPITEIRGVDEEPGPEAHKSAYRSDPRWSGDPALGKMLQEDYKVEKFINGHTHGNADGPLRYECGSDYKNPRYKIMEI